MICAHQHRVAVVLYDGIENSVFQSQVLQPLQKRLQSCEDVFVTIISFESRKMLPKRLIELIPYHHRLRVIMLRKIPLIIPKGTQYLVRQLKLVMPHIEEILLARGPLAGVIALQAYPNQHDNIIVQARGLCAEEYRYVNREYQGLMRWWHQLRYHHFVSLERDVYSQARHIESVSQALREYLIAEFNAAPQAISIAVSDTLESVDKALVVEWRHQARALLRIPPDALVYCYSGSFKPWQCAEESIAFVSREYLTNPKIFLLILSQDRVLFFQYLERSGMPPEAYRVEAVRSDKLTFYLAAADFGLLFRELDIVNWVSRPTKLLEYEAVGLAIKHNNTVAHCIK